MLIDIDNFPKKSLPNNLSVRYTQIEYIARFLSINKRIFMKNNRFLLALALCTGLQFNTSIYSSEQVAEVAPQQSYWQMYAPQFMKDTATATSDYIASWIPDRIKNAVNKMSTNTKIAVAVAIMISLGAYNREAIMKLVNDALQKPQLPQLTDTSAPTGASSTKKGENDPHFSHVKASWMETLSKPYDNPISGDIEGPQRLKESFDKIYIYGDKWNTFEGKAYEAAVKELIAKGVLQQTNSHFITDPETGKKIWD